MAYTSQATIEAKLGSSLTTEQAAYYNDVLAGSIDSYIDRITGTTFGSVDEVSVYVSGDDSPYLTIPTMHEITSISSVEADGTETAIPVDEYSTYPRGEVNKYALRINSGTWDEGFENYKIVGKLGFKEIPDEIVMVATELAINGINESDSNVESEKVGDWSVKYGTTDTAISSESKEVLSGYLRLSRSI